MAKYFNYTGTCIPEEHYMVDTSNKMDEIMKLIEQKKYFTINRPRQYGKTTTMYLLNKRLEQMPDTIAIKTSFESVGENEFQDEKVFITTFLGLLRRSFALKGVKKGVAFIKEAHLSELSKLDAFITELMIELDKKVVLFIDEVDQAGNNSLFLKFLAMLRTKYLARNEGDDTTFHSVILAGVHDVKTLKLKLRPDDIRKYNSPWNIAADFTIDLAFSADEISTMLTDYSRDKGIAMDIPLLSEKIHYYTSGYPFLVSKLCYIIDDRIMEKGRWTESDIDKGVKELLDDENTNFESLIKNLENNPELYRLTEKIILGGVHVEYSRDNTIINLGATYGIFKKDNGVKIHNRVYEQRIYNYMVLNLHIQSLINSDIDYYSFRDNFITPEGTLDFEKVLQKYQLFLKEQYSEKDLPFLERNGRLIFLAFIKPIINGKGFDFKEVQISEEKRLDIVVTYLDQKYIIELKIWRGEQAHERGLNQLTDYLDRQNVDEGYLVIYDLKGKREWKQEHIKRDTKNIFAVWV